MPAFFQRKLQHYGTFLPLAILFCLLLGGNRVHAGKGEDVIQKAQAKFRSLKTLSLRLEVQYKTATDSSAEQGRLIWAQGGRFRMETARQTIVSNGKIIWSYNAQENQVILYDARSENNPFLTPQQLLFEYPQKYRVQSVENVTLDDLPCDLLAMQPKDQTDPTKELRVWVDRREHFTRRLQMEDLAGNQTVFNFEDFISGQNLPDSTFHFVPPQTAEVIDAR